MPHLLAQRKVEVIITGSGDQRDKLETLCQELNLSETVRFLGFVSNEQLDAEYARCNVWVNPAIVDDRGDTEGLGVGAIEAYMHGKPVVASAVGGIRDAVLHGRTGLLVPEKNEKALAAAINWLLDNPAMASHFGRNGLAFARRQFGWDRITDELEDTYFDAIAARRPASTRVAAFQPAHDVDALIEMAGA